MKSYIIAIILMLPITLLGQNNWYVSPTGNNNTNGNNGNSPNVPLKTIGYAINNAWQPGDTIFVMNGTYRNSNYGNGNVNNGAVVSLSSNVQGQPNGWLIIRNYPGHTPRIQFDGAGGFIGNGQAYLEIAGFEIEGPAQNITHAQAMGNRLLHDNYFSGRGIAIWSGHHVFIHDNIVHDCPNSGIRVNNGDYITVHNNVVYNNTQKSSSAESAIVFATSQAIDTKDTIKMVMTNNLVYDNYNTIPFYSGASSGYGSAAQNYIIDGSGCYVTRNKDTYFYGWYYFANNVCFGNGINGLVVHKTDRAIVTNNTCYMNGSTPLSSGRQASSGLTINASSHVRVYNNISWARFSNDYGYKIFSPGQSQNIIASNNILGNGLSDYSASQYTFADPLWVDTLNKDFNLKANSPAIGTGLMHSDYPTYDFNGNIRDVTTADIGALAYNFTFVNTKEPITLHSIKVFPNPTISNVIVESDHKPIENIQVFNLMGQEISQLVSVNGLHTTRLTLNVQSLSGGVYILKVDDTVRKIQVLR